MSLKLQVAIAKAGICSRRQAEKLIKSGSVSVDGTPAHLGQRVDPTTQSISIDGQTIATNQTDLKYFLINKPVGVVSTTSDELNRPTVLSLLPSKHQQHRLYPVGRLDLDSQGLMLLTNDGAFTHELTHPKFETPKTYLVELDREPTTKAINHLCRGVQLSDGPTQPAKITQPSSKPRNWLEITITEGRNRQVRRMIRRIGYQVKTLTRVSLGPYSLSDLGTASWIETSKKPLSKSKI